MTNHTDLPQGFLRKKTLSMSDMATLLEKPYNTVKRWHERGRLPQAQEGLDGLEWPAHVAWRFAIDHGFRTGYIPFFSWPSEKLRPASMEARSFGIEVTYIHSCGVLHVVYPKDGYDSRDGVRHYAERHRDDVVVFVDPSLFPGVFYHVTVYQGGVRITSGNTERGTDDVAQIVGGRLPFWPDGLRNAVRPHTQIADQRDDHTMSFLEMRPDLVADPLRSMLTYHLENDMYQAYRTAFRDQTEAESMGHFDIYAVPAPVAEPEHRADIGINAVLAQHESQYGEDAAPFLLRFTDINVIFHADPLYELVLKNATVMDRCCWLLGHHVLAYASTYQDRLRHQAIDNSQIRAYQLVEGLYLVDSPKGLYYYTGHAVPRCPDEFDVSDPNSMFIRLDDIWMPIPDSERGYYVGDSSSADVALNIIDTLINGPYPVTSSSYDSNPWRKYDGRGGVLRTSDVPKRFGPGWAQDMLNTVTEQDERL